MFQVVQQYVDASAYGILLPLVSGHRGLDQDLPWILLHLQFLRQILPPFVDGNIFEPEKRGLYLHRIARNKYQMTLCDFVEFVVH